MSIGNWDSENVSRQTSIAMWITFSVMAILLVWAFLLPPKGEINKSVLEGCTLLYLIIPSAIIREAIKEGKGKDISVKHGETEITITGDENE